MPLQSAADLALLALGIRGDVPADALQPPLGDGIHLRWSFGPVKGFPWYGYYLLRRPHRRREMRCLRDMLRGSRDLRQPTTPGSTLPLGTNTATFPDGAFTSDQPLILTDDFPPTAVGELDLRNRAWLRFTFAGGSSAHELTYRVGLRRESHAGDLACMRFTEKDSGVRPNPLVVGDLRFTVFDFKGTRAAQTTVRNVLGSYGLDLDRHTDIELPCTADRVVLLTLNTATEGNASGVDANGKTVVREVVPRATDARVIDLRGPGITRVRVEAPQGEILLLAICYHCQDQKPASDPIRARAFAGSVLLEEQIVSGAAGAVVGGAFVHDLITAVEFTGGNGALVDLCYESAAVAVRSGGWELVPKCPQPLTLPVRHPLYPASGALPPSKPASENEAIDRIRYGDPKVWRGSRFGELYKGLEQLVAAGPAGPPMHLVASNNVPGSGAAGQVPPSLARYLPLNFVLTGALYAPVAQMLGLYWLDQTAHAGQQYDYLIIADHANVGKHSGATLLAWLGSSPDFSIVDAWVTFGVEVGTPAPLAAPSGLEAYALPGGTIDLPDGTVRDATNNTGLRWNLPVDGGGKLQPDAPVMYRVRHAVLGGTQPAFPVPAAAHPPVSANPQVVSEPKIPPGLTPQRPADWPPFALHFIDAALAEGWHSYRLNAVDLFGRYSEPSAPAAWHQWTPPPDPEPWYYQDALGAGVVHPHAIRLLDKLAPPPPTAVEAFALDPRDAMLQRDAPFQAWWTTLSAAERQSLVGLRVRWMWTSRQMRQAPDTAEFRVYYEPGQPNMVKGRVASAAPAGAGESTVVTDASHAPAANALVGLYLRADGRSYPITANAAGAPLTVTIQNLGASGDTVPVVGQTFAVSLLPGKAGHEDFGAAPSWQSRVWVVPYPAMTAEGVVPAPGKGGEPLAGFGATVAGSVVTFPAGTDLSGIKAFTHHVYLADDVARPSRIYLVQAVNAPARAVTVDGVPSFASSAWELGVYGRRYEVFLPAPGDVDRSGLTLTTSAANPIAYAQVGVTAADDKTHTADDPARAGTRWAGRTGNESKVGGPATIFRVRRDLPPPPALPPDSEDVFASRADYAGHSYYTFRWVPQADVSAHVFRAMDSALFARDWLVRSTRHALSAGKPEHAKFFPATWATARRNNAAAELNAIGSAAAYGGLSADARELLGRLPGNEGFASKGGLDERDWLIRHTRSALGSADSAFFPPDWGSALKRQLAANLLNGISGPDTYATLSNDARRVLAGLPGNEAAFQQVTPQPLPNTGPATSNRLGPDNPASFPLDPTLRAYIDRLDGRSTNRYFYRAAFVDAAQNVGPLGLSSPPVRLPDVVPPRVPVFTRVLAGAADPTQAGDGKITLRWASNREPDLAAYRLYRTSDPQAARDIRLMQLVQEIAVPAGDPAARPAEMVWTDAVPAALVTYSYRLVAVDAAGNVSLASSPIEARAYDTALPDVPPLDLAWVTSAGTTRAEITWTSPHEVLIQRRDPGATWIDLAQWRPPGTVTVRDPFSDKRQSYEYRAIARKATGALKRGAPTLLAAMP